MRSRFHVDLLSQDEVERIHQSTMAVLERIGIAVGSEPVLTRLAKAGARVDLEAGRVRFPPAMVQEAIARVPRAFVMAARDPTCDLEIDGSAGYLSTDGTPAHVLDLDTGERRPPTTADFEASMLLADALPEIAFTWPTFAISDVPPRLQPIEQAYLQLARCTKHAQPNEVITPQDARATVEMAWVIAGGDAELHRRPLISSYQCAISPLTYEGAAIEAAVEFANAGIPAGFVSMAVATASAPTTLAGHLVLVSAEILGGIVMLETLVPGAPTFYGPYEAFMDLASGDLDPAWGGEDVLFKLAAAQLARRYDLPINIMAFGSGASSPDWQAGAQDALSLMGVWLAGSADLVAAAGGLHGSSVFSLEQLALEAELFGIACRMAEGFSVTEEDLAVPAIEDVGPGGNFLGHAHTLRHMRERTSPPSFVRGAWEDWNAKGRPEPKERARELVHRILAEHRPEPLDEAVDRELRAIVDHRRRELKG